MKIALHVPLDITSRASQDSQINTSQPWTQGRPSYLSGPKQQEQWQPLCIVYGAIWARTAWLIEIG